MIIDNHMRIEMLTQLPLRALQKCPLQKRAFLYLHLKVLRCMSVALRRNKRWWNESIQSEIKDSKKFKKIIDPKDKLKLDLIVCIRKIILNMDTETIGEMTGLRNSDVSRIKIGSIQRITIYRLIKVLNFLGYEIKVSVMKKR